MTTTNIVFIIILIATFYLPVGWRDVSSVIGDNFAASIIVYLGLTWVIYMSLTEYYGVPDELVSFWRILAFVCLGVNTSISLFAGGRSTYQSSRNYGLIFLETIGLISAIAGILDFYLTYVFQ